MKRITLLITLLLMPILSCTAFASDNWQWVASNDISTIFFNPTSIKYDLDSNGNIDKNIIDIEIKMQFSKDILNEFIIGSKANNDTTNWDDFSYTLMNAKVNKTDRLFSVYMFTYYDTSGQILKNFDQNTKIKIIKNTIEADLYDAIVIYTNQHDKELERMK
ncbi:hypothetical protein [Anaerosinus massiliensis]|uniref:hypothetical protein n=1 Tax=Massilibacillus massiliensis TaxID=1806837 RepID=UPI000DA60864|nr:hypothetical protein [Massilibacillus massiliensis]